MKAEKKPYYDTARKRLADIIPLPSPFTVYIEVTRFCNIKCFYCLQSTRDDINGEMQKLSLQPKHMNFHDFKDVLKQLKEFPDGGIKRIVFSGLGEPLMNPDLPEMVKKAVDSKICDRVEIITNGILLTSEIADKLIKSRISNINVSIQGVTKEQYKKTCGKSVDINSLKENLSYLYRNRGNTSIYIKAIDATLGSKENEEKFYNLFGDIADKIYVEHLVVMQQQMDNLKELVDNSKNFYNEEIKSDRNVCAQAFYFLQVGCELDTFPCPVPGLPKRLSMGNMNKESLVAIWNGEKRRKLLRTMLKQERATIPECKNCTSFKCINNPAENLDENASELVHLFQ